MMVYRSAYDISHRDGRGVSDIPLDIHWEPALPLSVFHNKRYNAIIMELSTNQYVTLSADCEDVMGIGDTMTDSIDSFRTAAESAIQTCRGGIFAATSPFHFQYGRTESMWRKQYFLDITNGDPSVAIVWQTRVQITLFPDSSSPGYYTFPPTSLVDNRLNS
jgi:hypothetical protein